MKFDIYKYYISFLRCEWIFNITILSFPEQVFGELSSTDDEDKDVNIMDSGEEEAAIMSRGAEAAQQLIDGLTQAVGNDQDSVLLTSNDQEASEDSFSISGLYQSMEWY